MPQKAMVKRLVSQADQNFPALAESTNVHEEENSDIHWSDDGIFWGDEFNCNAQAVCVGNEYSVDGIQGLIEEHASNLQHNPNITESTIDIKRKPLEDLHVSVNSQRKRIKYEAHYSSSPELDSGVQDALEVANPASEPPMSADSTNDKEMWDEMHAMFGDIVEFV